MLTQAPHLAVATDNDAVLSKISEAMHNHFKDNEKVRRVVITPCPIDYNEQLCGSSPMMQLGIRRATEVCTATSVDVGVAFVFGHLDLVVFGGAQKWRFESSLIVAANKETILACSVPKGTYPEKLEGVVGLETAAALRTLRTPGSVVNPELRDMAFHAVYAWASLDFRLEQKPLITLLH